MCYRRFAKPLLLSALTLVFGSVMLNAQTSNNAKKVLGYQDPDTGVFHPLLHAVPDTSTPATTGTFKVTLNITLASQFAAATTRTITCGSLITVTAVDTTDAATEYTESAYKYATGGGGVFTCTMTIPYSWVLPTSTIQKNLIGAYTVTVSNSTTSAGPPVLRLSTGDFLSTTTVPTTGTTTTYTVNVTI